jgi:hypothetical protein
MANYTARIELHSADSDEYDLLHQKMEADGFRRWIKDKENIKYALPTAEYSLVGSDLSCSEVRDIASTHANAVKRKPTPGVLVTESKARRWSGLKKWKS